MNENNFDHKVEYVCKLVVMDEGERVVIIINNKTSLPHEESSRYLLLRKSVVSMNSLIKEANALCFLLCWEDHGKYSDIIDFIENAQRKNFYSLWMYLKSSKLKNNVNPQTHAYRWRVVQKYFQYLADKAIGNLSYKDPKFQNLCLKRDIIFRQMAILNTKPRDVRKQGVDQEVILEVIKKTRSGSPDNPWIKRDQVRNQLVIDLLIGLGLRASELLKISLSDIHLGTSSPCLVVKRVIDDPLDTRKHEPRVKTFGRILDLCPQLVSLISEYIKERRTVIGAKRSKYLLVSNAQGTPLSYARLRRIVESVKNSLTDSSIDLTPHTFRRSWNDSFRNAGEQLGLDENLITQNQNYLQGRTLESSEAYKYAGKHIEKSARETHLIYQKNLFGRHKHGNK